jgi:uncharacterized membrane protein
MGDDGFSPENVVVVSFTDDDSAYEALTTLNELASQGQIAVEEAAIVTRGDDGHIEVKDRVAGDSLAGTASGGLVGVLVGILGGPLGVLLGGATGLLVGSLFDLADSDEEESVLGDLSKTVRVGRTALLAQVMEQSPEVIDAAMERLSGTVVRRPVYDVEAEIAAAREAQAEAKRQARKELRKARHDKNREGGNRRLVNAWRGARIRAHVPWTSPPGQSVRPRRPASRTTAAIVSRSLPSSTSTSTSSGPRRPRRVSSSLRLRPRVTGSTGPRRLAPR